MRVNPDAVPNLNLPSCNRTSKFDQASPLVKNIKIHTERQNISKKLKFPQSTYNDADCIQIHEEMCNNKQEH